MQQMIEAELTRLSCDTRWHTLIERLLENLADVEAPHRDGWAVEHEILAILREIGAGDPDALRRQTFARKLPRLEGFLFRAMRRTASGPVLWNPLEQPLSAFRAGSEDVVEYWMEQPYPPADFVTAWSSHYLGAPGD